VDVIHTSGGSTGMYHSVGHADFFPNGGSVPQPGCYDGIKFDRLLELGEYAKILLKKPHHGKYRKPITGRSLSTPKSFSYGYRYTIKRPVKSLSTFKSNIQFETHTVQMRMTKYNNTKKMIILSRILSDNRFLYAVGCSHSRAYMLYQDSVYHASSMMGVKCMSWSDYENNNCDSDYTTPMGHDASPKLVVTT